jgi:hypothetical protein
MRKIDFLIIGATKSATTWLQQSLQRHPEIYMPDPELHFFSREYEKGMNWYASQFASAADGMRIGEKSNSYMDTPEACGRIRQALPHVLLLAQLRNPVERAYSDYCMLFRRGEVGSDIGNYLDPRVAAGTRFLNGGLYYDQLRDFMDSFPTDQLLILLYEDIVSAPERHLGSVAEFLRLDVGLTIPPVESRVKDRTQATISPGLRKVLAPLKSAVRPFRQAAAFQYARNLIAKEPTYTPLGVDLKCRLIDYYTPQVEQLESVIGRQLLPWLYNVNIPK